MYVPMWGSAYACGRASSVSVCVERWGGKEKFWIVVKWGANNLLMTIKRIDTHKKGQMDQRTDEIKCC